MYHRTGGLRRGRDGCRVPLPWTAEHDSFGFSPGGSPGTTWLPQPDWFADHAVDRLLDSGASMLHLYREALALRHRVPALSSDSGSGSGELRWLPTEAGVLAFTRGDGFACVVNCSSRPVCNPVDGPLLLATDPETGEKLPPNSAAWVLLEVVA
jgi:alpha-glucosidase